MNSEKNPSQVTQLAPRQSKVTNASQSQEVRGRPRRNKSAGNESARDALLRVMVATIDEHGEPGVRLEKVLRDANASVSSMYHHFGSLGGLIEVAQIERLRRSQQMDIDFLDEQVRSITTVDEFREVLKYGINRAFQEDRRILRAQRVNASARAYQNPHYQERLSRLQREANEALENVLIRAQAKGLIASHIDIEAAAAWWTSTLCARYFVEILGDSSLEDRWAELAQKFALVVLEIPE